MANLDILRLLDHRSVLYSLEAQAALGHRESLEMLRESLREHPSPLVPRGGQTSLGIQGLLLNLCCQETPSLHGGRENLY